MRDKMHDLTFTLDAAFDGHHGEARTVRRNFSKTLSQITRLAMPVSSSSVTKMTPLALP